MAFEFTNNNDLSPSINFISSNNLELGTAVSYKQISFGNYTLSGNAGNKTVTISQISGLNNESKNFYFEFSDNNVPSNNYISTNFTSGTIIINNVNTSASSNGTVKFFDYVYSIQESNLNINPEYIVTKKILGTPNSYTGVRIGHLNLSSSAWDSIKESNDGINGLISGSNYYLSSVTGKITTTQNNFYLFKALSKNRAFINLSYYTFNWSIDSSSWKNSDNIDLAIGKTYKINGITVLSSNQLFGKNIPSGDFIGSSDSQNLTNKTINSFTYPTSDGSNGDFLITNGSGNFSFANINFITDINMNNTASGTIDISSYSYQTSSFKITNPGTSINFTNGLTGKWYTVVILSNGNYSFSPNCRFPLDNAQPIPSASGSVDVYSLFCLSSNKFLSTFAYGYNGVS